MVLKASRSLRTCPPQLQRCRGGRGRGGGTLAQRRFHHTGHAIHSEGPRSLGKPRRVSPGPIWSSAGGLGGLCGFVVPRTSGATGAPRLCTLNVGPGDGHLATVHELGSRFAPGQSRTSRASWMSRKDGLPGGASPRSGPHSPTQARRCRRLRELRREHVLMAQSEEQ